MRRLLAVVLALWIAPAAAAALSLDGKLVQGGLVVGRTEPGAAVTLDGMALKVSAEGVFLLGFGRDAGPEHVLRVRGSDGTTVERRLKVAKRRWRIQRIDGLPPRMVTPSPEQLKRIRAEAARIRAARAVWSEPARFLGGFVWPAEGPISGVYGSQRILNGKPRAPHLGLDIAAPKGTPVRAAAGGRVTLAEPDLYFTGGTVIIDHGLGVNSVYSHLSRLDVAVGDTVAQGAVIGAVGASGRVTGPHLDWRIDLFQERLDPALLVPAR